MTTPAGSPPWLRTASIADYGGDTNKTDYLGIGIINPKTDVSAEQLQRLANDAAAFTRVLPLCTIVYTCNDTAATDPTVTYCYGQAWNYSGAGYDGGSPPTGYPSVVRNSNANNTITFASSYTDSFGVSGAIALHMASPRVVSITNDVAGYVLASATQLTVVTTVGNTAALATDRTVSVSIW